MSDANTVSGSEGRIVVMSASGTPELLVTNYRLTKGGKLGEITNSTSGGHEKRKKVVKGDQLKMTCLWDSTKTPEDASLDFGAEFTADLRIGSSTLWYVGSQWITESCEILGCTQDAVVTFDVTAHAQANLPAPSTRP